MFVMAIDVQSYRADSVRILKEGSTILIECLERVKERPASLTQTGVFNKDGSLKVDKIPALKEFPTLSSCNYSYHRVALPENFAKHGLKYGYDDVSRHVVITGKLLPSASSANGGAPTPAGNKVKVNSKSPAFCNILWREKSHRMPTYHELWNMAHKKFHDEELLQKGLGTRGSRKQLVPSKSQNSQRSLLGIEGAVMKHLAFKNQQQLAKRSKSCVNVKGSRSNTKAGSRLKILASRTRVNGEHKFQKDQNNAVQQSCSGGVGGPTSKDKLKKTALDEKRSASAVPPPPTTSPTFDDENNVTQVANRIVENQSSSPEHAT